MPLSYAGAVRFLGELEAQGIKLGLENIRNILASMGDPQRQLRSVIIGGTNGKGSVASMLQCIASRAGLLVGLYTSPHLVDCRERIVVGGRMVSRARFSRLASSIRQAYQKAARDQSISRPPTYFEALTAMALQCFKEERVDLAVMEVGMGGRFDAVNVVTPLVSIITNVALDHTQYLGKTVREIAQEKAGIIKPRVPVLTMASERALTVIRGRARQVSAPLHEVASECRLNIARSGRANAFSLRTPTAVYDSLDLALAGRHQIDNALCAVRAAELLSEEGFPIGPEAIRDGLRLVQWPGRLDLHDGAPRILLDAAHNPDGARTLKAYLGKEEDPARTLVLFGLTQGRDPREMARLIVPLGREVIATRPPGKASIDPRRLKEEACRLGIPARAIEDWGEALALCRRRARKRDLILVTGSIYLVGAVLSRLRSKGRS